jgi:hypothetical protein
MVRQIPGPVPVRRDTTLALFGSSLIIQAVSRGLGRGWCLSLKSGANELAENTVSRALQSDKPPGQIGALAVVLPDPRLQCSGKANMPRRGTCWSGLRIYFGWQVGP